MIDTLHNLIDRLSGLSPIINSMDLKRKISDGPLPPHMYNFANQPQALEQIAMTAFTLTKDLGLPSKKMKKMLRDLLAKNTFYGSYYELGVYRWLNCNGVHYVPQPLVSQSDVLCQTGDVDLDGRFKFVDIYFDIKSFGFQYVRGAKARDFAIMID